MRYNREVATLVVNEKYALAMEILQEILQRNLPSLNVLSALFGQVRAPFIRDLIRQFVNADLPPDITPRKHIADAPTEISDTRNTLESNEKYQAVQRKLLLWELPEATPLRELYGELTPAIRRIYGLFLNNGLRRKCGVSSAAHLNRVGALAGAIGLDRDADHTYSSIGALHDAIEDLLHLATDASGKKYGLKRYRDFLDDFLPHDLQNSLELLTNHYDLILGHVRRELRKNDQAMTSESLLRSLELLQEDTFADLEPYVAAMHALLMEADLEPDVYENAKWLCYRNLYVHKMASQAHAAADYRTYETKALDISDNANGRDALAMSGRIKNIVKMDIWAREGYALGSSWPPLNNHIMEFEEDALVHAEHMVIRDFLEPVSSQDFVMSGLLKIRELRPVFFVDEWD